jgi:hypothetical protein
MKLLYFVTALQKVLLQLDWQGAKALLLWHATSHIPRGGCIYSALGLSWCKPAEENAVAPYQSSINQNVQPAKLAGQLTLTHYHVTPEPRRE